jgi:hypothetical protein
MVIKDYLSYPIKLSDEGAGPFQIISKQKYYAFC